jgi:transcription elongation factor GreB
MSRAFVSDSQDEFRDQDVPEIRHPLPEGVKNYMTPEGASRMRGELSALERERAALAGALSSQVAGSAGPEKELLLNERRRLREIDRRARYLARMLDLLEVVDPGTQDPGRVLFGAWVTVLHQGGGEKRYRIVGVDESDPAAGLISWRSPLARALTGGRAGDRVRVKTPGGEQLLEIRGISYG